MSLSSSPVPTNPGNPGLPFTVTPTMLAAAYAQHAANPTSFVKNATTPLPASESWPCPLPPTDLKPTTISALRKGVREHGCYILLRIVSTTTAATATATASASASAVTDKKKKKNKKKKKKDGLTIRNEVEDINGDKTSLAIVSSLPTNELFLPPSWTVRVKAPFFKADDDNDDDDNNEGNENSNGNGCQIEVWHFSDLQLLSPLSNDVPAAWRDTDAITWPIEAWRMLGKNALDQEQWDAALTMFSCGLEKKMRGQGGDAECLAGRTWAYAKLGWWEAFQADAEALGDRYAVAQSLYEQSRYSEAKQVLGSMMMMMMMQGPVPEAAVEMLRLVELRLAEEKEGAYNWSALLHDNNTNPTGVMKVAEYIHPAVEVREIPGRGRGLVLTADVPAATLLLATNADFWAPITLRDQEAGRFQRRLQHSPRLYARVLTATSGDDYPRAPLPSSSSSTSSSTSSTSKTHNDDVNFNVNVDTHLLSLIFGHNGHSSTPDIHSVGLWVTGALVNHSCLSNCGFATLGSLFILRSRFALSAGTELTLSYISPLTPYEIRSAQTVKNWGFVCTCELCTLEAQEIGALRKERQLILDRCGVGKGQDVDNNKNNNNKNNNKLAHKKKAIKKVVRNLDATYLNSDPAMPRLALEGLMSVLTGEELERVLGDERIVHAAKDSWKEMVRLGFEKEKGSEERARWERRAREVYCSVHGEDRSYPEARSGMEEVVREKGFVVKG